MRKLVSNPLRFPVVLWLPLLIIPPVGSRSELLQLAPSRIPLGNVATVRGVAWTGASTRNKGAAARAWSLRKMPGCRQHIAAMLQAAILGASRPDLTRFASPLKTLKARTSPYTRVRRPIKAACLVVKASCIPAVRCAAIDCEFVHFTDGSIYAAEVCVVDNTGRVFNSYIQPPASYSSWMHQGGVPWRLVHDAEPLDEVREQVLAALQGAQLQTACFTKPCAPETACLESLLILFLLQASCCSAGISGAT